MSGPPRWTPKRVVVTAIVVMGTLLISWYLVAVGLSLRMLGGG